MQPCFPFPQKLYVILSFSTLLSVIVSALAAANVNYDDFTVILISTYGPLTFLTLIHHLIIYLVIVRPWYPVLTWSPGRTNVPRGLTTKTHLWFLGLLELCWMVGVAMSFIAEAPNSTFVANVVFAIFEVLVLLHLFVVCIRGRRMFLKSRNDSDESNLSGVYQVHRLPTRLISDAALVDMASQRHSWTLPFTRTIIPILSLSTFVSIMVSVFAAVNVNNDFILICTYGPLTFLSLVHHLTIFLVVRKSARASPTPKILRGVMNKTHLWLLGILELCWTTGIGLLALFVVAPLNGALVANIVFMIFEFSVLLFLFVVCVRGRKRCMEYSVGVSSINCNTTLSDTIRLPTIHRDPPPYYESDTTPNARSKVEEGKLDDHDHDTKGTVGWVESDFSDTKLPAYMDAAHII